MLRMQVDKCSLVVSPSEAAKLLLLHRKVTKVPSFLSFDSARYPHRGHGCQLQAKLH